jgi:hypothetical protein
MSFSPPDAFCSNCGQQLTANTLAPRAEYPGAKGKRSFGSQVQSGLGLMFLICAPLSMLAQLDNVMTHHSTSSDLLSTFVVDIGLFVLGYALFRIGRGKSVRIDAPWKRNGR